eukprot:765940-Hanusia_phi.AAC.2
MSYGDREARKIAVADQHECRMINTYRVTKDYGACCDSAAQQEGKNGKGAASSDGEVEERMKELARREQIEGTEIDLLSAPLTGLVGFIRWGRQEEEESLGGRRARGRIRRRSIRGCECEEGTRSESDRQDEGLKRGREGERDCRVTRVDCSCL